MDDDCDGQIDTRIDHSVTAPIIVEGSTCGAGDNCAGNPSEEHVYEVTIPSDGSWDFDLCNSSYDTYLLVGTTPAQTTSERTTTDATPFSPI